MTVYEDLSAELFDDDAQDATRHLCPNDCPLSHMVDGCCPECASLCQSAPRRAVDALTRRAHLVNLTRRAFLLWSDAVSLYNERMCAFRPSASCIEEAHLLAQHRYRRYELLEARLSQETGLPTFSIFNDIAQFPDCSRLLRAGL